MIGEQAVEQHLVAVVQRRQIDVLAEVVRLGLVLLVRPPRLLVECLDGRGDKAVEPEFRPFLLGERRALVQQGTRRTSSPRADVT
jgi:hypothetical protein